MRHVPAALAAARRIEAALDPLSPWALPDMPVAVERIRSALKVGDRIGIFGDYDCDGITAAAQIIRCLRRRGCNPVVRLPHRVHDGYGLRNGIIGEFVEQQVRLLITVDTGIGAVREIAYARSLGMDVIVTDHHHLHAELPPATALLHPALAADLPLPHPSGAGVAFLLVAALEGSAWKDMETDQALAMIGTVADLVELRGMNRSIVRQGLRALARVSGPVGILRDRIRMHRDLRSGDIAFRLAPRINAAGRMDDPTLALRALLEGGAALDMLEELNRARQETTRHLLEQAIQDSGCDAAPRPPLLASASPAYPPGIVGLLAGSLTERTGCPSLVGSIQGDFCTASLRSTPAYHITEGLERCAALLESYGGHAQAAGCTFRADLFPAVTAALSADIAERVSPEDMEPCLTVDAELSCGDVHMELCTALEQLEPFGQGNPEPRFLIRSVLPSSVRVVGDGKHLQALMGGVKAIGFHMGPFAERITGACDLICRIGTDTWNGCRNPQLLLEDLRPAHAAPLEHRRFAAATASPW